MAALGALSHAWTSADTALPLNWRIGGLYRFDELWVGLAEGPEFDDYLSGSGSTPSRRSATSGPAARAARSCDGLTRIGERRER
jgi:hypothetical protein